MLLQNISNTSFSKSLTHEYRLYLIMGINNMYYMIVDEIYNVITLKHFDVDTTDSISELKTILSRDEKLLYNYKGTKIGIDNHAFTLVPNRLFNTNDKGLFLKKTSRIDNNMLIQHDFLLFNESQLVYAWNPDLIAVLKNYFPTAQMFHLNTSLANGWRKKSEVKEGQKTYIHVKDNFFTIAFFDGVELVFINRFSFKTSGDFLYYVLMSYDRFDLKPESIPCTISGFIVNQSEIYKKLFSYIRHLHFMPSLPSFEFPDEFNDFPHHQYFDLYSLKLCES